MRKFNSIQSLCLLAMVLFSGTLLAQSPANRGNQHFTIQNAPQQRLAPATQGGYWVNDAPRGLIGRAGTCDTIFSEDFQSQTIPATWQNLDLDGNTDANARPMDWYIFIDGVTTTATDTNYVVGASSWFTPFAQANNVLIMDKFNVCDPGVFFQWQSAPAEGPGFMDGYRVMISTTDSSLASFTDTLALFAEDASGTGAGVPGPGIVHTNFAGNNGILTTWNASLAAYNGQDIWIAFFHDSDDDNQILVDNIFCGLIPNGDLAVVSANYDIEYPVVPITQVQPMNFNGRIANQGAATIANPMATVNVSDGASVVYTGSSSIDSLLGFSDSLFPSVGPYTPATTGFFTANYSASSSVADPDNSNDSVAVVFAVDDSIYAREDGTVPGTSLSIGQGNNGIIGQTYDIFTTDTLTAAGFFLINPVLGDTIDAVVLQVGALGPFGAPLATSAPLIITDTMPNYYELAFAGGLELTPGTYFIGLNETVNGRLTVATDGGFFTPGAGWVFFNGNWSNSEDFNFLVTYVLRGIFGTTPLVGIESSLNTDVTVYPNPTADFFNVKLGAAIDSDLQVRVMDIQGRTLIQTAMPAASTVQKVDVSNLASGMYLLEVSGVEGRHVERISVR